MLGLSRHRVMLPLFIGEAVANVAISVLLARSLGVVGVAIGTMIPRLVVTTMLDPVIATAQFGIRRSTYIVEAWVRPTVAMTGFAAATYLIERFWPAHSLAMFFFQVALVLPIAALGAWLVSLDDDERQWFNTKVASLRARGRSVPSLP